VRDAARPAPPARGQARRRHNRHRGARARARREREAMPATRALNEGGERKPDGDSYASRNDKVSELWRPGAAFRPTTFLDPKGPKVRRPRGLP